MKTSVEKILNNIEWNFENICNLLIAFQEASNTSNSNVTVKLKDKNGIVSEYEIKSFQNILTELQRIDNNFKSLLNSDNISTIVNADGSLSQITKTTFINAYYYDTFSINPNNLIVDKNSTIQNFLFPNVKLPININIGNNSFNKVNCLMYDIDEGFNAIKENITIIELKYLIETGKVTLHSENELTLDAEKEYIKFNGQFTILDVKDNPNNLNQFKLILDKTTYSSINNISDTLNLKVGNLLADKDGTALYKIDEIDLNTKTVVVSRIKGVSVPKVGINQLSYNQEVKSTIDDEITVGVPIKPNKKLVIFLRTENQLNIGFPSEGIKLDTSTYQITYEDQTMSLDVFFSKYVTNFSDYLVSLIKDTTIPYSLGIKPKAPVLLEQNFNIVQVNRHLTTSKSAIELQKNNEQKESIKNTIEYKKGEISTIQNEIDTVKYKTFEEKKFRQEKITALQNDINSLSQNLLNITRDLNDNAIKAGLKNVKPKYKLIGFWELMKPIISPSTKPQYIIGYEIQYRYLSKNIDVTDSTVMKMYDSKNNEISVAVSPWNILYSKKLTKVENIDGTFGWENPKLDSVDDININQVAITINEGESIEVKVRAISEAGYPISPMTSDWSNIIRYDFPQNLIDDSLFTLVEQNSDDLSIAELTNLLRQEGIITHIGDQVQEAEKLFYHKAENITSGFFTSEMKNIPLNVFLRTLRSDMDIIMKKDLVDTLSVSVIDFNNEEYTVLNNTTLELNGGNYSDTFSLVDSTKFGSIIRKKGFIKLRNNSTLPIELKTYVPGTVDLNSSYPLYYNVPVILGTDNLKQQSKQIIYFRNVDITRQDTTEAFKLIKSRLNNTPTKPDLTDINNSITIEEKKNIIYLEDGAIKTCALNNSAKNNFIVFTKEHPFYEANDIPKLINEFKRVTKYTENLKALNFQDEVDELNAPYLGFKDNDIFTVGKNSCGAFLYPIITNPENIKVVGNSTVSTLIIPKDTEILIPFVYEYRMIDRLGNINGDKELTINDDIIYSKKIGMDLMINNELFSFDINVTSKLKAKITPIESLNISSVVGSFNNNTPNTLI